MPNVYVSSLIQAPVEKVWAVTRNFNSLPEWHPEIETSRIEQEIAADQVGCVRAFRLKKGGFIRERLLSLSDYDYSFTYQILESPMALSNYQACFRLLPITDVDHSFAEWSAKFDCTPKLEAELVAHIAKNVFQTGFDSLKRRVWD